ncbi:MaoC family dehydratase [Hydrogenophaga sp. BPS33]|uniref:MaoC family dehydratase n=1 Tax=Hydrogenophaga sp. BPS33 TaxID=2651974 RepID=UPI00131F9ACA|nr:MaoC family dehydratase [Hydrogenophaga sp. BPS33]QHE87875.1 3-alpha,7-alpha,12-alpha-trihydroxy-5-beta-cholest-24-enoyl-CoA hydratase [Hydrogenophaga sp. BPS33]
MLDYENVRNWTSGDIAYTCSPQSAMLYALGVGMSQDPLDRDQLRYTTEKDMRVLPSMATVLAHPGFWIRDRKEMGIDHVRMVHGEQAFQLHRPLPSSGAIIGRSRVTRVVDKGAGKGALIHVEKRLFDATSDALLAVCDSVVFCRGDGGFSANGGGDPAGEAPKATPDTAPDLVVDLPTRPETALIYRLSGDYNPLHSDPDVATAAGFPRPILHGLGTYGVACHGLVKAFCGYDAARLKSMGARFSAPTFPGDVIRLECWRTDEGIAFRARVPARDVTVLSHGHAVCSEV